MVTLTGLVRTFKTARKAGLWQVAKLYVTRKPQIFRIDDTETRLSWQEYRSLRNYWIQGYEFKFRNGHLILILPDGLQVAGNIHTLEILQEPFAEIYGKKLFPYQGARVLDVGGYAGETMLLFFDWGANSVVVYEPIPENCDFIHLNARMNGLESKTEIYQEGIAEHDHVATIRYTPANCGFSVGDGGNKKALIQFRDIRKVIENSKADIAKFDCEGAEQYLESVSVDTLRVIPNYTIETHSTMIREALMLKFRESGFTLVQDKVSRQRTGDKYDLVSILCWELT
jgi:FkbM family methyltransferase